MLRTQLVAGSVLCGTSRRIPEWKISFSISFSKWRHSETASDFSKAFVPGLFLTACHVIFTKGGFPLSAVTHGFDRLFPRVMGLRSEGDSSHLLYPQYYVSRGDIWNEKAPLNHFLGKAEIVRQRNFLEHVSCLFVDAYITLIIHFVQTYKKWRHSTLHTCFLLLSVRYIDKRKLKLHI